MIKIWLFCALLLCSLSLTAEPVDIEKASLAAYNWLNHQIIQRGLISEVSIQESYTHMVNGYTIFYVFNFEPEGFVIVSGNDASEPILGYNYKGTSTLGEFNCNIESYFDTYILAIKEIYDKQLSNETTISTWEDILSNRITLPRTERVVEPLISTNWNQGYPWNTYCPADPNGPGGHVYAGCVAVAMAQVVRYWSLPAQGNGSHSYYHDNYGLISANFGATTYNYANMPNNQATDATAELLFHLGVSVEMNYGPNGSGAYSAHARDALVNYFNYHSDAQMIWKEDYTTAEWVNILKGQLDSGIPLYYRGQGSGGHAFNCDGYDANDYFHFNWGWGGSYNGYFNINNLNPGSSNYSESQATIINLYHSVGYIVGDVNIVGGDGELTQVELIINNISYSPSSSGEFTINISPGSYNLTASLSGYQTVVITNVEVYEQSYTIIPEIVLGNLEIATDPVSLNQNIAVSQVVNQSLNIVNTGAGDFEYSIYIDFQGDHLRKYSQSSVLKSKQDRNNLHNSEIDEQSPTNVHEAEGYQDSTRALFDLLYSFPAEVGGGEYSVASDGQYIYTSTWNSEYFYRYTLDGIYLGSFTVTGVSNIRDLTYDGQYFYGSPNNNTIYKIDLANETLINSIITGVSNIRGIAYDAINDGFWVTNGWSSPLRLISRQGITIQTLNTTVSSMSGLGWENFTDGVPYLWAITQAGDSDNTLCQIDLSTGLPIQNFDLSLLNVISPDAIAGGMMITNQLVPETWTFLGMAQNDVIWVVELTEDIPPWLVINPLIGIVPTGESILLDVSFDASGLEVGTYNAQIFVNNYSQLETVTIPVQMNVLEGSVIPAAPLVSIQITDGMVILDWEMVEDANSYYIYASNIPDPEDWGQPITQVAMPGFSESVTTMKFYRVTASSDVIPLSYPSTSRPIQQKNGLRDNRE